MPQPSAMLPAGGFPASRLLPFAPFELGADDRWRWQKHEHPVRQISVRPAHDVLALLGLSRKIEKIESLRFEHAFSTRLAALGKHRIEAGFLVPEGLVFPPEVDVESGHCVCLGRLNRDLMQ